MRAFIFSSLLAVGLVSALACSSGDRDGLATGNANNKGGNAGAPTAPTAASSGDIPEIQGGPQGEAGTLQDACVPDPMHFEVPGNNCDDDGDGQIDNVAACDTSLAIDGDAEKFAHALGICQKAGNNSWGLVSASYRKGYNDTGAPADGQHGIMNTFGSLNPREGGALGVLSTGWARLWDDASKQTAFKDGKPMQASGLSSLFGGTSTVPPGYPKSANGCPNVPVAQDAAVVHLEIKVPTNAKGLQFDFDFLSGEWPEWVCTAYNDSFIAYLKSAAFNGGVADNVSFDAKGNPVSINNGFFDRCTPNTPTGCMGGSNAVAQCSGGESEIVGTGFEKRGTYCGNNSSTGGGGTGWLTSQAPVQAGETITLEFYVWDGTDGRYDSSVLLDNFRWVPEPVKAVVTTRPPK